MMEPENYVSFSSWKTKSDSAKQINMDRTENEVKERKFEDSEVCNSATPQKKKLILDRQTDMSEKVKPKKLTAMLSTVNYSTVYRRLRRERMSHLAGASSKPENIPPLYPTLSNTCRRKLRSLRKSAQEMGLPFHEEAFVKQHECQAGQKAQQTLGRNGTYEKCLETAVTVKNGVKSIKLMKLEKKKAAAANDYNVGESPGYNVGESPKVVRHAMKDKLKEKSSLMKCGNEDDTSSKKLRRARKKDLDEEKSLMKCGNEDDDTSPKKLRRARKGGLDEEKSLMKCGNEDDDTSPKKLRRARKEELDEEKSLMKCGNEDDDTSPKKLRRARKEELDEEKSLMKCGNEDDTSRKKLRRARKKELDEEKSLMKCENEDNDTSPKKLRRARKKELDEEKSLMKCENEDDDTSPKKLRRARKELDEEKSLMKCGNEDDHKTECSSKRMKTAKKKLSEPQNLKEIEGAAKPLTKVEKRKIARKKAHKIKWEAQQEIETQSKDTKLAGRKQRFVLFAGNLSYGATSDDIMAHFTGVEHRPVSVRIAKGNDDRMTRGFAYIEYKDVLGYQFGFTKHHSTLGGRTIRVLLSESGKAKPKDKNMEKKPKLQGCPILI